MSLDQILMVMGMDAAYGGGPPGFTPADLSPVSWFRLGTGGVQNDDVTPASADGDVMKTLYAEGDATKYFQRTNGVILRTQSGRRGVNFYDTSAARYLLMTGVSTLITQLPQWSLSMWIKAPVTGSLTGSRPFFAESHTTTINPNAASVQFNTGIQNSTAIRFVIYPNSSNISPYFSQYLNGNWFDDAWHHLAFTDDNGTVVYYMDGVAQAGFSYTRPTVTITRQGLLCAPRTTPGNTGLQDTGYLGNNIVLDNKIWTQEDVDNLYAFG
jgi:hypothetical protein